MTWQSEDGTGAGGRSAARRQARPADPVDEAIGRLRVGRWLLAVSGGRDSMVLLHAFARARPAEVAAIATFDHGTGDAARRAVALVRAAGIRLGIPVVTGRQSSGGAPSEASWRDARWRFLHASSQELDAEIVTAHTLDDQVETVALRILRGAGARGLAGMSAEGAPVQEEHRPHGKRGIVRPLLRVPRAAVEANADRFDVRFIEDPSNVNRVHARNRMRHDLLPALEATSPGFRAWLGEIGARAGAWRAGVESLVDSLIAQGDVRVGAESAVLNVAALSELDAHAWGVLWPAVAARLGIAMDRRGVVRASEWAPASTAGSQIQLAGSARIDRLRATFVIRRERRDHALAIFNT